MRIQGRIVLATTLLLVPTFAGCSEGGSEAPASPAGEPGCGIDSPSFSEEGDASYYADSLAGNPTASGEPYDPEKLSAAHRTLPFGTVICVTNTTNGRSVEVTVNDRGPFHEARVVDVSRRAAEALDLVTAGRAPVRIDAP